MNPAGLMNGRMFTPQQQQQLQQQQQQQQRMAMGGNMMGGGMQGGSISPAQLMNASGGREPAAADVDGSGRRRECRHGRDQPGSAVRQHERRYVIVGPVCARWVLTVGTAGPSSSPPASMASMANPGATMNSNFAGPVPPGTPSNAHHPQHPSAHSSSPTHPSHPHMSGSQIQTPHLPSHMSGHGQQHPQTPSQQQQHPGRGNVLQQLSQDQIRALSSTLSPVQIQALAERLNASQMGQLALMPPNDRAKVLRHYFGGQQQQQQQQQQQAMGMMNGGMGSMDGMGSMNGMNMNMGGMNANMQMAQLQMQRERMQQQQQQQQQQQAMMDSGMSNMGMNMGNMGGMDGGMHFSGQQQSPNQPQPRPMSSSGQQHHMHMMMPPPSSIPPRPTTASSNHAMIMPSASPRPGSSASHHAPQPPQIPSQPHTMPPTSRPGTAGSGQGRHTPVSSAGSPGRSQQMAMPAHHHHLQQPQQPQVQQQFQPQPHQPQPQLHQAPVAIQPRPPSMPPGPRPGTAGGSVNGVPSRPGTAQSHRATPFSGQGQSPTHGQPQSQPPPQNFAQQRQNGSPFTPNGISPTSLGGGPAPGYPPIAPAPVPGSPSMSMRGVKRKVSETPQPIPPQQQQQQQQQSQPPRAGSIPPPPQQMHTPTQNQNQMRLPGMNVGMPTAPGMISQQSMMGGAGGGMMGPPVFPRSGSQGPADVSMNIPIPGMNVPPPMARQPSAGSLSAGLSVNTNMGVSPSASAPNMLPSAPSVMPAGTPTSASSPANLEQQRQGSVPPGLNALERKMNAASGSQTQGSPVVSASAPAVPSNAPPTIVPALPPLPAGVTFNPKTTRITIVPLADSLSLIPALEQEEVERVQVWMQKDKEYEAVYRKMKERMGEEVRGTVLKGRAWWEKSDVEVRRRPGEKFHVTGFKSAKDEGRRRKVGKREGFKLYVFCLVVAGQQKC